MWRPPPRRPGRPPALVKSASVSLYLPVSEVDLLAKIARRHDVSMSALLRRMVRNELAPGRDRADREAGRILAINA